MDSECHWCGDYSKGQSNAILFNILSRPEPSAPNYGRVPHACRCETRRKVCLRTPDDTCRVASGVLVKTMQFMRSLPAFQQLPPKDQLSLLQNCWTPLFILGLAQDGVHFAIHDAPAASMLKQILLNRPEADKSEREQPTLGGVQTLKACLKKFRSLDLSPKEYAYLKGTIIFNPDVPGLKASLFVEGLQYEAQQALKEVLVPPHPEDTGRFARILLAASTLKVITPALITELFFRPVIGQADLLDLLMDMLFTR
ncbi:nuclear receptor subfamily 0 group B member 2a [Triplophysa dalaica]|uniref:nuclear receptor subfamily 0 group B member 2a n=1 Tax=Triplophysa dalaica TaxID=1582913 RepID=UPI0024DF34FF|nr:nuclear receptor subfamily 0 group B member 2a [Triplophysa dalaica]XP_056618566.1 nuclear receptor subfamily 0 group B member 2a [Triplophysa dalaica]